MVMFNYDYIASEFVEMGTAIFLVWSNLWS
jgi:hypothetical protein